MEMIFKSFVFVFGAASLSPREKSPTTMKYGGIS